MSNDAQIAYWNSQAGETWAAEADTLDPMLAPLGEAAMAALAPKPGERIVDIGCGAGATSRALFTRVAPGGAVLGVDVSAPLIGVAQARGGGPDFALLDAGSAPYPAAPYDAAFSRFGVMFFEDPAAGLGHIRRQLKPGGRIAFLTWRTAAENAWATETVAAAIPHLKAPPDAPADPFAPGPFAFGNKARTEGHFAAAGFKDVSLTPLDTHYTMGASADAAAETSLKIGPLGRLIREQGVDRGPVRAALVELFQRHMTPAGPAMGAACWVITARA